MKNLIKIFLFCFALLGAEESAVNEKLKQALTEEEFKTFMPYIEADDLFIVNKSSNNFFTIKGYFFKQNPEVPVSLGDQFLVSDENKETLDEGSYKIHVTLTSLESGFSQEFVSLRYVSLSPLETIVQVTEKKREYHSELCSEPYGGNYECGRLCCHVVWNIVLNNGASFEVDYYSPIVENDLEGLAELSRKINLYPGDSISINPLYVYPRYHHYTYPIPLPIEFTIYRNSKEIYKSGYPNMTLSNSLNIQSEEIETIYVLSEQKIETFSNIYQAEIRPDAVFINNFGNRTHVIGEIFKPSNKFHKEILAEKSNIAIKLIGHFNSAEGKLFVFQDSSDCLYFVKPS